MSERVDGHDDIAGHAPPKASGYSWYVLSVLVVVYILNFIDRQIVSILVVDIQADLGLTNAQMGFLGGAAFGVFYALFGIPLGRLADNWSRTRLLSIGLALWSAMTVVSGFSKNGAQLGLARMGVGIGEATASPSAYSLISDYFPKHQGSTSVAEFRCLSAPISRKAGISLILAVGQWVWSDGKPPFWRLVSPGFWLPYGCYPCGSQNAARWTVRLCLCRRRHFAISCTTCLPLFRHSR
jgi:MFS family permease